MNHVSDGKADRQESSGDKSSINREARLESNWKNALLGQLKQAIAVNSKVKADFKEILAKGGIA